MEIELEAVAAAVRAYPGLRDKASIGLVSEVFGASDWLAGPGDDGAAVPWGEGHVIACGEALLPAFVARDPFGAGIAAVLTNINDVAAMGARPLGIVNTIVADEVTAREILRGLRYGCELYDVPLLGGHLTRHDGTPGLSAFAIGAAGSAVLSMTHVRPGHSVVFACSLEGEMRTDFPFFRGFDHRIGQAPGDVRLLAEIAEAGAAVAAKDVSMAGIVGSLAMLLEHGRYGCTIDLDLLPVPTGVELARWLTCFPNYAFVLTTPPGQVAACVAMFHGRGLAAVEVGTVDATGVVAIGSAGKAVPIIDLAASSITGLTVS